jgi:SAM-dependent methyltransferase
MSSSTDQNVKNYYEQYWLDIGEYSRGLGPRTLHALESQIRLTSHVLEVGCGPGRTVGRWSVGRCAEYIGVDVSNHAVKGARELGLDARVIEDASSLPFDDSTFDVVVCLEVLEHLFQPHLAAREMLRVLRPSGVLIATVPNLIHWRHRLLFFVRGGWDPSGDSLSLQEPWRDPHIRFFAERNFGHALGDELCCIAPLTLANFTPAAYRAMGTRPPMPVILS